MPGTHKHNLMLLVWGDIKLKCMLYFVLLQHIRILEVGKDSMKVEVFSRAENGMPVHYRKAKRESRCILPGKKCVLRVGDEIEFHTTNSCNFRVVDDDPVPLEPNQFKCHDPSPLVEPNSDVPAFGLNERVQLNLPPEQQLKAASGVQLSQTAPSTINMTGLWKLTNRSKNSRSKNISSKKGKSSEKEDEAGAESVTDKAIKDHVESMQGIEVLDSQFWKIKMSPFW